MATSAIPTKYDGVQFRSRTEAKWAAFMDLLGWSWAYEPLDFDGYIPDFWVNDTFWLEVKAALTLDDLKPEVEKVSRALALETGQAVIVGGQPIFSPGEEIVGLLAVDAMLIDENAHAKHGETDAMFYADFTPDCFVWRYCRQCRKHAFREDQGDWTLTCGHDHRMGDYCAPRLLEELWREASNLTQWRSPMGADTP